MVNDFVPTNIAKIFQNKGAPIELVDVEYIERDEDGNEFSINDSYPTISHSTAIDWLHTKGIDIEFETLISIIPKYGYTIRKGDSVIITSDLFDNKHEAIDMAISYCITNLI